MVNNSTNINKTNIHLAPQIIEHKNDHDMMLEIQSSHNFILFS